MGIALASGCTIIVQSRFDPEKFLRAVGKYKVCLFFIQLEYRFNMYIVKLSTYDYFVRIILLN